MQLVFDLFPVIIFFAVYQFTKNILIATGVLMAAMVLQFMLLRILKKPIQNMHWISLILVLILGGATLLLQDKIYIQWKPTIINWLFGLAFLLSPFFGGKSLLERLISDNLELPKKVWNRLNIAWASFFIILGFINIWVFKTYSENVWVNFKLFGILGLTIIFVILQGIYISRYLPKDFYEKTKKSNLEENLNLELNSDADLNTNLEQKADNKNLE